MQASNCVFSSLTNNTHIVGPMSKIIPTFDHLSTQLALIGLRVKVSKCKLWSPLGIFLNIKIFQIYVLVTNGLYILVCQWVIKNLPHIFKMRFYLKMRHILMIFLSLETHKLHWAFCFHVSLINLLILFGQYLFLLLSHLFWRVLTVELCKYVATLWVQGHGNLFKAF
jgi:hypothetical protein